MKDEVKIVEKTAIIQSSHSSSDDCKILKSDTLVKTKHQLIILFHNDL